MLLGGVYCRPIEWSPHCTSLYFLQELEFSNHAYRCVVTHLLDIVDSQTTVLDRWAVSTPQWKENKIMNAYCGIGVDAQISLNFHLLREHSPQ